MTAIPQAHHSLETAWWKENFPYGRKVTRCAFWIETHPRHGQRVKRLTIDPDTGLPNRPRTKSRFEVAIVFYVDERGFLQWDELSKMAVVDELDEFVKKHIDVLTDDQLDRIAKHRVKIDPAFEI